MNLHKKVQVVVINNEKNQVLLLQTKADRGHHWQNVTGSVDPGEDYLEAAHRELLEETGLKGELTLLDLEYKFHDRWKRDVVEKVYVAVCENSDVKISDEEHQDFKWVDLKEVNRESFGFPSNFESFSKALESL